MEACRVSTPNLGAIDSSHETLQHHSRIIPHGRDGIPVAVGGRARRVSITVNDCERQSLHSNSRV